MISIVMPAHNEQGYLEPAVKAVVAAGRDRSVPFEVVIVENGSTDSTVAEAEGLAQTFAEVTEAAEAGWISTLRPSRWRLCGFLRLRNFLNSTKNKPDAEGA